MSIINTLDGFQHLIIGNEKDDNKAYSRQDRIESMLSNLEIEMQSTVLAPLQKLLQQHSEARASNQLSRQLCLVKTSNRIEACCRSFVSHMKEDEVLSKKLKLDDVET